MWVGMPFLAMFAGSVVFCVFQIFVVNMYSSGLTFWAHGGCDKILQGRDYSACLAEAGYWHSPAG